MTREEYLNQPIVNEFINWIVNQEANNVNWLNHSYLVTNRRWFNFINVENGQYTLNSLNDAFNKYYWAGGNFNDNTEILNGFANELSQAIQNNNNDVFIQNCIALFNWGNVPLHSLNYMGQNPITYINNAIIRLNVNNFNLDNFDEIPHINSGYTKLYSLLIDNFIIYDGRVGAALGLLTRKFLNFQIEQNNHYNNNEFLQLNFAWGAGRGDIERRNPSWEHYIFPRLAGNHPGALITHLKNNMRANWIISEISNQLNQNNIEMDNRMLEASLFMIGYDVRQNH